jgi:hypothetical protein
MIALPAYVCWWRGGWRGGTDEHRRASDERLDPNLSRDRGKSIDEDLDVDEEGSE